MRTYIIGNDGIALCRETPAAVNDGEMVVSSREELLAAPLNGSFWHCGTRCPVSRRGEGLATARR